MANAKAVALSVKFDVILSLLKMMGLDKLDDDNIDLVFQTKCSKELKRALSAACDSAISSLTGISSLCK